MNSEQVVTSALVYLPKHCPSIGRVAILHWQSSNAVSIRNIYKQQTSGHRSTSPSSRRSRWWDRVKSAPTFAQNCETFHQHCANTHLLNCSPICSCHILGLACNPAIISKAFQINLQHFQLTKQFAKKKTVQLTLRIP